MVGQASRLSPLNLPFIIHYNPSACCPSATIRLRRTSPLDGLVLENSGTGVSPVHSLTDATQTGETPVPLSCIYRDDAHGILPRIRSGADN